MTAKAIFRKAASLAVIGSLVLGTAGTAMAAPVSHYHHVYRHYGPGSGPAIGAAVGAFFGMAAAAAAMANGYGPYYGPPGYYGPAPFGW